MREGRSIEGKLKKSYEGTEKSWKKCLKPALNITSPYIGMTTEAKAKNLEIRKATSSILKSISGGKILSLSEMRSGAGLSLRVM